MGAHGGRADDPVGGDLLVRQALGDEDHDLALAIGQLGQRGAVGLAAAGPGGELGDQPAGHRRRQQGLAAGDDPHGPDELGRLGVLDEEPGRAGSERLEHVLVELERRQDEHADVGEVGVGGDRLRRSEPVEPGHPDVHQHDVGALGPDERQGRLAVAGLADDLDPLLAVEQDPEPGPDELLVVGEHDPDHGRPSHTTRTRYPPAGSGPIVAAPPVVAARSRIPTRPRPEPPATAPPRPPSLTSSSNPPSSRRRSADVRPPDTGVTGDVRQAPPG